MSAGHGRRGRADGSVRTEAGAANRRKLGALIGVVVLVGAGGWFAGTQVRSPADVAAAHKPPAAGPVTVAVEERPLTATVVASGSLEYGSPRPLRLAGPVGSAGGPEEEGTEQRVTKAPVAGTVLKEGDVLMAVSGRPVLVLKGTVPMYRTIAPGTTGDDVTQLQQALRRIGFEPGAVSGTYRSGTASAVTRWYKSKGYPAHGPTAADRRRLAELRQAVTGAQVTLLNSGSGEGGSSGEGNGSGGDNSGEAEGVGGERTGGSTERVRKLERKAAQEALDAANGALSDFEASYGTKIPSGEVVFLPELPARLDKAAVSSGDAATGDIGTVTSSELLVRAVVPGADAPLLRPGLAVAVETPDGKKAVGKLEAVGDGAGDGGTSSKNEDPDQEQGPEQGQGQGQGQGQQNQGGEAEPVDPSAPVQLRITVPAGGALGDRAGGSVKTTIKVGASKGTVLAVPVAAVHTSADGQARVRVQRSGRVTEVPVTVGIAADGLVEVAPSGGGELKKGDLVVVGA
ncbi:peptidoglycan-binding protein [Streptomyces sp. NPDC056987]|uniref:peptidoglycan-binding protein n=1 Tax=Streptomyces sp. NPDC056987 TaxID=3345988 RepID=UPI00363A5963